MSLPITQHFSTAEFDCHDGTPYPVGQLDDDTNDGRTWLETRLKPLCDTLEVIRTATGNAPITIDSGFRTLAYDDRIYENSAKDGTVAPASKSQHPKGRAADITHSTLKPTELFNAIMSLYAAGSLPNLGGCGLYPNFVHVDVRPRENNHLAIWGGKRPSNIA